jgi:transcriptional regulator with XRE-family HTH domain
VINNKNKKFLKAFGENLFRLRTERKLSQEELANEADIPINQVGRIERAEVNTTISTVYSLASALKVKPASLFDF